MSDMFPNLFSPLTIKNITLKNRIFSTGHMTTLVTGYKPNEDLAAYHEARARGHHRGGARPRVGSLHLPLNRGL